MTAAFVTATNEHRAARARFLAAELTALLLAIASEWTAKLTANPLVRARNLPDLRKMRPAGVSKEAWFKEARFTNPHSR